jgi:hypothetical protein
MRYEKVKNLKESDFKRLCGVKKETFLLMSETISKVSGVEKRGRKSGLSVEDQVLLTLSYWREYRTMFHLGQDFGLHESNVSRVIQKVEDVLIKCGKFSLPSKRRLLEENELNYTIVDVTEMTIERPKKNKSDVTAEKRSDTRSKVS